MVSRFRSWWQNTSKTLDAVIVTPLVALLRIMVAKLRSWWQKIKQHPMRSTFVSIACVLGIVLLIGGYFFNWTWTGLGPYVSPPHPQGSDFQRGKTLYDWLQLAIIPAALTFGVWWLTRLQQQRDQQLADQRAKSEQEAAEKRAQAEREAAEKRAQTEREIALDNQRAQALQAYIDNMSALLLEHENIPADADKVRNIARVRTLTVLPRLDGERKSGVLQFLHESGLIDKDKKIIDLRGADLSEAILRGADLSEANLRGADLSLADLGGASLGEADLSLANLSKADLGGADLGGAILIRAILRGADLRADLREADLREADLGGADLGGAILIRANLSEAYLGRADLSEAYLGGANLKDATDITTEQLDKAKSLEGATMPDGTKHA